MNCSLCTAYTNIFTVSLHLILAITYSTKKRVRAFKRDCIGIRLHSTFSSANVPTHHILGCHHQNVLRHRRTNVVLILSGISRHIHRDTTVPVQRVCKGNRCRRNVTEGSLITSTSYGVGRPTTARAAVAAAPGIATVLSIIKRQNSAWTGWTIGAGISAPHHCCTLRAASGMGVSLTRRST
jgi:hypothetical protein